MSKAAMKLALDLAIMHHSDPGYSALRARVQFALKKALAEQPAQQEPVLQDIEQYRLQMAGICAAAIGHWKEGNGIHPDYDTVALRDVAKLYAKYNELYRAPPAQRTFVGLTDEEYGSMYNTHLRNGVPIQNFTRDIEAKLKEKNT